MIYSFAKFAELEPLQAKHNLTASEVALRWLQHHSPLTPNDFIVIGGSRASHIESNCVDSAKGPLPAEVVEAAETAWLMAKSRAKNYFTSYE
jgi:aflatoxin B1 aldehyde reductase